MANIGRIVEEITTDPLGVGYSTLSDGQVAAALNVKTRGRAKAIESVEVKRYMFAQGLWLPVKESALASAEQARDALNTFATFQVDDPDTAIAVEGVLDALVADALISATDKEVIQAMGVEAISRAQELGILTSERGVTPFNVHKARLRL